MGAMLASSASRSVLIGSVLASIVLGAVVGAVVGAMLTRRCGASATRVDDDQPVRDLAHHLVTHELDKAKLDLDRIPTDSIYKATGQAAYDDAVRTLAVAPVAVVAPLAVAAPPCDADALRQKGEDHLQTGMDAAALAAFEASMKCRPDGAVMRFAFMAACRSKNAGKAKYYYPKLPAATTTGIVQICIRNGVSLPIP